MKAVIRLAIWVCLCFPAWAFAQKWRSEAEAFQAKINSEYADTATSPLLPADISGFHGLDFFPIDKRFCVQATLERTPDAQPFDMPTVSGKTKKYVQYGILHFKVDGKPCRLEVFQSLKLREDPAHKDHLFVLFKDLSSGEETYGGGRYIDLTIPKGRKIKLDFNQAYNPYCAYSTGWSCPIPPPSNFLDIKILAGVKAWHGAH